MDAPLSATEYWRRAAVVDLFEQNDEILPFEVDLLASAARDAGASGPLDRVRVVGVGAGRELPAVRAVAPVAVIEASDISTPMIDACRRNLERHPIEMVDLTTAPLQDLTPEHGRADMLVAINAVLCYLTTPEDRRRGTEALANLLRPGGSLAVITQQRNGRPDWAVYFAARGAATRLGRAVGAPGDRRNDDGSAGLLVHHYTPKELRTLLTGAGFERIQITSLRSWGRRHGHRIPLRSPNPLLLTAVRGPDAPG